MRRPSFAPSQRRPLALALLTSAAALASAGPVGTADAATTVLEIHSPGPAMRMSGNGKVTGFYVAKCTTLSSQPKRTICYNAPWLYDGHQVSKLAGKFPSNANAKAVAVNDAGQLIGADLTGAWLYSSGTVAYVDAAGAGVSSNSRLHAVNNAGTALGMSYLPVAGSPVYQPITYQFNGVPRAALQPGYSVVDINDAGMIAGWFRNGAGLEQPFVAAGPDSKAASGIVAVPGLPPVNCRPVRLSQRSAAGAVWVAINCAGNRAFRYRVDAAAPEELLHAGSSNLSVVSINGQGTAAGTAVRPGANAPDGYTALLWAGNPSVPLDLNANQAFAPAGAWNVHATDINEAGTVLTGYNDTAGNFYTFLVQP